LQIQRKRNIKRYFEIVKMKDEKIAQLIKSSQQIPTDSEKQQQLDELKEKNLKEIELYINKQKESDIEINKKLEENKILKNQIVELEAIKNNYSSQLNAFKSQVKSEVEKNMKEEQLNKEILQLKTQKFGLEQSLSNIEEQLKEKSQENDKIKMNIIQIKEQNKFLQDKNNQIEREKEKIVQNELEKEEKISLLENANNEFKKHNEIMKEKNEKLLIEFKNLNEVGDKNQADLIELNKHSKNQLQIINENNQKIKSLEESCNKKDEKITLLSNEIKMLISPNEYNAKLQEIEYLTKTNEELKEAMQTLNLKHKSEDQKYKDLKENFE